MRKKDFDFQLAKELNLVLENEQDIYQKEGWLAKNYSGKWKKGKFDFKKARKGVRSQVVDPFVRSYQKQWLGGSKVPSDVRDAVSKARLRDVMRRIKEKEY